MGELMETNFEESGGIVEKVRIEKKPFYCKNPEGNGLYNPIVDIKTNLPILTYPILDWVEDSKNFIGKPEDDLAK